MGKLNRFVLCCAALAILLMLNPAVHAQSGTTYEWIGGGCGSGSIWIDPDECDNPPPCQVFNWDPATCNMSFKDTAIIPRGFTVSMIDPVEVGTLQVAGLLKINNNLSVNSATLASVEIDSSSGPVFTAHGPVTFNGNTIFSRGTLAGAATFTVAGGEFHLSPLGPGLARVLDGSIFMNNAVVHADLGLQFRNAAEVFNSGTWHAKGTLGDANPANSLGAFKNFGSFIKGSTGGTTVLVPLDNFGGSIEVSAGTLNVNRGGNHSAGIYQLSGGSLSFQGFDDNGTPSGVRITGPMTASGSGNLQLRFDRTIIQSGGSLASNLDGTFGLWIGDESSTRVQCDGMLINEGLMTWTGGRLLGNGQYENKSGGVVKIQSPNGQQLNGVLWNRGAVEQSTTFTIDDGIVQNDGGSSWQIASGNIATPNGSIFRTSGQFVKVGTGTSNIHAKYELLDGTTTVSQGTLDFRGGGEAAGGEGALFLVGDQAFCRFSQGAYTWSGARFEGSGEVRLAGATFDLSAPTGESLRSDMTEDGVVFESGQIVGVGALVNGSSGKMTWSGGTIAAGNLGDGGVTNLGTFEVVGIGSAGKVLTGHLANQGDLTAASFTVDGGKVTNFGTVKLTGGTIAAGASPGNIFNLTTDGFHGSIDKIGGGTTNVWPPITNQGTINVVQGWLELKVAPTNLVDGVLSGGTWRVWPNAALKMPGIAIVGTGSGAFITLDGGSEWKPLTDHLIENGGVIRAAGAGQSTCNVPGGTLFNKGGLQCAEGGTLNVEGTIQNDPGAWMEGLPGFGPLAGVNAGGFIATTLNNHGTIRPGGEDAAGTFNLTGNLVCHETSVIEVELAGLAPIDEHDQLNVVGNIALAGTLDVSFLDDFEPAVGSQFTILTAKDGTITGTFGAIVSPIELGVEYSGSAVILTAIAPQIPGDLTGDGSVGVPDLLLLLGVWGVCPDSQDCPADLDKNGAVGVGDLLTLLANWG